MKNSLRLSGAGGFLRNYVHSLDRLAFVSRQAGPAGSPGRRTGSHAGYSVEFADYRKYDYGDDIRYVDWSIYSRLRKLFLRQFRAEAELSVHLLIDTSNSMSLGMSGKLDFARNLAAALGYVGLRKQDRVGLATFSDDLHAFLPPRRGQHQLHHLIRFLDGVSAGGRSDFYRAFRSYAARASCRGMLVVLSDCFCEGGYQDAFRCLAFAGFEPAVIRILADEEVLPDIEEEVELRDLERQDAAGPVAGRAAVGRYREALERYSRTLSSFCLSERIPFVDTTPTLSFEELILRLMRAGVWRSH
jgi:uncharacterized protein (DUF58 family)